MHSRNMLPITNIWTKFVFFFATVSSVLCFLSVFSILSLACPYRGNDKLEIVLFLHLTRIYVGSYTSSYFQIRKKRICQYFSKQILLTEKFSERALTLKAISNILGPLSHASFLTSQHMSNICKLLHY